MFEIVSKKNHDIDWQVLVERGLCEPSAFRTNRVDLYAGSDEVFSRLSMLLDTLGFRVTRSNNLNDLFVTLSEDPYQTGLAMIVLDHDIDKQLEGYFRLFKMLDPYLPVLILDSTTSANSEDHRRKTYSDCVHKLTCNLTVLSNQIYNAFFASLAWASEVYAMEASVTKGSQKLEQHLPLLSPAQLTEFES